MTENHRPNESRLTTYWPFFVGGLVGPLLSRVLSAWVPLYVAAAASFFAAFSASIWVFDRSSRPGPARVGRNLAASALGGTVVGLLTYLFSWR